LASQNLVGYESQKSAREIRNRFKVAKGRKPPGFLQPLPETGEPIHRKQSALSLESEEPIMGNDRFFYSRSRARDRRTIGSFARDQREPIGSLPDRQKEAARPLGLDPDFGGPFTRTLRARALRPKPEPEPARRGEARRASTLVCSSFFLSPTLARAWRASNYLS
jgi:hypothetical protein